MPNSPIPSEDGIVSKLHDKPIKDFTNLVNWYDEKICSY